MSIQAVSWVLDHSHSRHGERLVLIAIANHYDFNDPALVVIARESHLSRSAVIRAIQALEKAGELVVQRDETGGRSKKNRYRIPAYERSRGATDGFQTVAFDEETVANANGNGSADATRTVSNHLQPGEPPSGGPDPRVSELVAGYVDDYQAERNGLSPSKRFIGAAGRAVKQALADGRTPQDVAVCLGVIAHEGKQPASLEFVMGDMHAGRERRMK